MMTDLDSHMAMSAISHAADMAKISIQQAVYSYEQPSAIYRPKVYPDGDKWCALYGDNIQDGVCGFGDSPADATHDFNQCWNGLGKYAKPQSRSKQNGL